MIKANEAELNKEVDNINKILNAKKDPFQSPCNCLVIPSSDNYLLNPDLDNCLVNPRPDNCLANPSSQKVGINPVVEKGVVGINQVSL